MKLLPSIIFVAIWFGPWSPTIFAGEKGTVPWATFLGRKGIHVEMRSNGRDTLTAEVSNRSSRATSTEIPAGIVCELAGPSGRVITLRAAPVTIEAGGITEVEVPTAALSAKNGTAVQACVATQDHVTKLQPLLTWLAGQQDVPRATTQIVVLSLMEDISFSQWQAFVLEGFPGADPATHPSLTEVVQAVDALSILREVVPGAAPQLTKDAELKIRALRNPLCRAKAAELYGLEIPAGPVSALGANAGSLLHRAPNDNCPICRARARANKSADGL